MWFKGIRSIYITERSVDVKSLNEIRSTMKTCESFEISNNSFLGSLTF